MAQRDYRSARAASAADATSSMETCSSMDEHVRSKIPVIYTLPDAAELRGVRVPWFRSQLRCRRFAALKRAGRWAITKDQILAAIEAMTRPISAHR